MGSVPLIFSVSRKSVYIHCLIVNLKDLNPSFHSLLASFDSFILNELAGGKNECKNQQGSLNM